MQTGNWRTSFRAFALGAIPKWHQNIYSTLDLSALLWVYVSFHPEKMLAASASNRVSSTSQLGTSRCFIRLEVHFRSLDLKFKKSETLIKHRNKTWMEVSGSKPRNVYFGSFFHIQCHESWIRFCITRRMHNCSDIPFTFQLVILWWGCNICPCGPLQRREHAVALPCL